MGTRDLVTGGRSLIFEEFSKFGALNFSFNYEMIQGHFNTGKYHYKDQL